MTETNSSSPASPTLPRRILLVEDNEINQEVARAVLEAVGHQVDVVADGRQAVAAVQSVPYDVVLMDIQMPVMDGVAATRQIRSLNHPASSVPIIAMTASVLPQQVRSFFDAGMNGHVGKPFKREELFSAIDRWASQAVSSPPPLPAAPPSAISTLNRETFDSIQSLLGRDKTDVLLERLGQQIQRLGTAHGSASRETIAQEAHAMISAAGLLGFASLSNLCREIEDHCTAGSEINPLLQRVEEIRPAVLDEIESIRQTVSVR
jgi:CheY-like chemotaxis protein/HPt (histidine-containing phosphotransfer) domain-containing protein